MGEVLENLQRVQDETERLRQQLNQKIEEKNAQETQNLMVIHELQQRLSESCPAQEYEKQQLEIAKLVTQN